MKTNYLFPNQFKNIGWFLFVPGLILGIIYLIFESDFNLFDINVFAIAKVSFFGEVTYFSIFGNNVLDELAAVLIIVGALFITLSREKIEDEFISKIRLESLVWATYVNYFILILSIIFIYDLLFLWVLVLNIFTLLIFFIIRFNWKLYKSKKQVRNEE